MTHVPISRREVLRRGTATPEAIGADDSVLRLDDALSGYDRAQRAFWMEGDAVNLDRFRAGRPADWMIADKTDKTGTGALAPGER